MTSAIEAWYPSQVVLQNSIERVKKFVAKLITNDFKFPYPTLLEKVDWKPDSHGKRSDCLQLCTLPIVLRSTKSSRHIRRIGYGMELTI
uniref:Uncharacterized protein n=1 Tax=Acrobeloides nanus TaxID=290746 RepID=A0A914DDF5_9BILA